MNENIIYIECKHCGGLMPKTNYPQHLFCSVYCQNNFLYMRNALINLLNNPNNDNGVIAETIRVLHNNWLNNFKYTGHLLTKTFDKLIDSGYIVKRDIDTNQYKLSDKFYYNFNEIGIDKNKPL